jgi:hypothetical protein
LGFGRGGPVIWHAAEGDRYGFIGGMVSEHLDAEKGGKAVFLSSRPPNKMKTGYLLFVVAAFW